MTILAFLRENARWLSAGVLLTFLSSFGQTFFISIFAGEIRETFQISHGQWGGIYALGTTASAMVMVWAGGLTDRFRVRRLGAIILMMLMVSCLFMALNPVWWLLPLVIFCLRFTGQGMTSHIAVVAMGRWFIATRGKALSVATLGFAVGEALLPLIFVALMVIYDWRLLWGVAAIIAIAGIPILLVLLREERTPQSMAQSDQALRHAGPALDPQPDIQTPAVLVHGARASGPRRFQHRVLLSPGAFRRNQTDDPCRVRGNVSVLHSRQHRRDGGLGLGAGQDRHGAADPVVISFPWWCASSYLPMPTAIR